jgi:hypothetical protein
MCANRLGGRFVLDAEAADHAIIQQYFQEMQ